MEPTSPLIRVDTLRERLDSVTVLDVRYRVGGPPGLDEYDAGHVPGAAFVDLDTALAAAPADPVDSRGRHPLPEPDTFVDAMQAAGVDGDRPVVVYDDWQGRAAARAWWLLRHFGHDHVQLLDGGWSAWLAAGGAVEVGRSTPPRGSFRGEPGAMATVTVDSVTSAGVLIDARAPERFRGEVEPLDPVAGHIPGAVNVDTGRNLDHHGRFREPAELRALYAGVGAGPGVDVSAYCGSGVTATHDILAMEVAGIRAALFPASWSGWVADPARPVGTGDED